MDPKTSNSPDANAQRTAYDEFSAAFADIEKTADTLVPDGGPPAAAAAPEPTAEPVATAPAEPAVEPVAEPAAEPAESVAATPPAEPDAAARIVALEAQLAEIRARPAPEPVAAAPAPAAEPVATPEPAWYQYNDDEKAALDSYDKDWADISKAESIRRKADIFNAVAYVFAQMKQHIEPKLKEFAETSELITSQLALGELRRENQDYDTIYDAVGAWVDTLPTPFRAGAKQVMESGTTEDVNALIKEYRKAHPAAPGAAPAAAAPVAAGGKQGSASLSPAAKQAAQRLSVVGSKRSTQRGSATDPNDFDGAWEEALRESNA